MASSGPTHRSRSPHLVNSIHPYTSQGKKSPMRAGSFNATEYGRWPIQTHSPSHSAATVDSRQGAFSPPRIDHSYLTNIDGLHFTHGTGAASQIQDQGVLDVGTSDPVMRLENQLVNNMENNWATAPAHEAPRAP
jgi:hypothetical protein